MTELDVIYGVVLAIVISILGSFIFIEMFTDYHFWDGVLFFKAHGLLGKIITLGAILNLFVFFILLKLNKDFMARGVILGMIVLTIVTLLV